MDLATIRGKGEGDKVKGTRRLSFQIPEEGNGACARSFEDAFVLANKGMFGIQGNDGKETECAALSKAEELAKQSKADFAIKYAIEDTDWAVPQYIKDGLLWLASPVEHAEETGGGRE